jgi:PAS domain S-box-containing protein
VVSAIRDRVVFATHNVLRDPPFSRQHLISCRNLLIDLDRELQEQVMAVFRYACRDQAYLFLGASELADEQLFRAIDKKHRIFIKGSKQTRAEKDQARLAAIVESSEDAIISKSLEGIVTSWNDGAWRLFGYSAEEMLGQPVYRIIPFERSKEEAEILARLRRGERLARAFRDGASTQRRPVGRCFPEHLADPGRQRPHHRGLQDRS